MTTIKVATKTVIVLVLSALFFIASCHGAVKYLDESPQLTATIEGTNEFFPGKEANLVVVVENRETAGTKILLPGTEGWPDRPGTAKLVRVTLRAGDAPALVRTDPQMVGDLPPSSTAKVPFTLKFLENATGGSYLLPVVLNYTYLSFAEQRGYETLASYYKEDSIVLPLEVKVTPRVFFTVKGMQADDICSGQDGIISVTLENTGVLTGKDTTARIVRHGKSPIVPVDGNAYIGEFAPAESVNVSFRIHVQEDAQAAMYPLDTIIEYRDSEGSPVLSDPVTVGIPVLGEVSFSLSPEEITIPRGGSREFEVTFKNTGPVTVRSAQARVSYMDPFSSSKDTATLGDLLPGQESTAKFQISVDKSATPKVYGLGTEVRYRDALDNRLVTSPVTLRVAVVERSGLEAIITNPVYASILGALVVGAGYAYFLHRKKRQ